MNRVRWAAIAAAAAGLVFAAPAHAEVPTLGVAHPAGLPDAVGLGTVRPTGFSLGSMATSTIRQITWDSWGGSQAEGHGVVFDSIDNPNMPINLVALDLGTCNGQLVYRQIDEIPPGQTYDTGTVFDLC
jgi:hypothetical protein